MSKTISKKIRIWYHAHCLDGFASAWVARNAMKHLKEEKVFVAVKYGEEFPEYNSGDEIFILDFSYPREKLIALYEVCNLIVIDHHKPAAKALEGLDFVTFDNSRSGAGLTWQHFHGDKQTPQLVNFVEDRDLWKFTYKDTKAVCAFLSNAGFSFGKWDEVSRYLQHPTYKVNKIIERGELLLDQILNQVKRLATGAKIVTDFQTNTSISIVNSPMHQSELGDYLLVESTAPDYAFVYYIAGPNEVKVSLRSRASGNVDVSIIARQFGGNGHRNAAGCTITQDALTQILTHGRVQND